MKAIINLPYNSNSSYRSLNGNTFEIKEVLSILICLLIPNEIGDFKSVDFSFKEVLIVNVNTEIQKAYDSYNCGSDYLTYNILVRYCKENKIQFQKPTYYCPA